jgi:predicted alpha/beta hydrolase
VFWIGHSFGGLYILAALSMKWLDSSCMAGLVTMGSQISHGDRYLKIPPVAWAAAIALKTLGYFPAPRFGLGPEIEPAGVILETIRWKRLFGKWTTSAGVSYWDGLRDIRLPVLTLAAENDRNDPPAGCRRIHEHFSSPDKTFLRLGKASGFSKDYDHVGMVVSRAAQNEIWPMVAQWMAERGPGQET